MSAKESALIVIGFVRELFGLIVNLKKLTFNIIVNEANDFWL